MSNSGRPKPTPATLPNDFERMVPEYHRRTITYGEHVSRYQAAVPLVKGKVVLDIACGSGYGAQMLSKAAKTVYGVDVSVDAIAYAQSRYPSPNTSYLVGDGVSIPLDDASVDVVVTFETIEHIEDYQKFLDEVKRVLRPGGIMILSTPNDLEFAEGNHFHVHEFKYDELTGLLKSYFKHMDTYFQGTWVYAALFSADDIKSEWDRDVRTINTMPLDRDQTLYFFLVCSDEPVDQDVPALGVISEHWSARKLQEKEQLTDQHITNLKHMIEAAEAEATRLRAERDDVRRHLQEVHESRTFKFAQKLQRISRRLKP